MSVHNATKPNLIVGIGASAGGLEAFSTFLSHMPCDSGMAFILIPHLDPTHNSMMTMLLSKKTDMTVHEAEENMLVQSNHVYIISPGKLLSISNGHLHLTSISGQRQWIAIEHFLRSLALEQGDHSVAVILSGTGSHGTLGFRDVKLAGGLIIAQDPSTTVYNQMPINAIDSGLVDVIARLEDMPDLLAEFAGHPYLQNTIEQTSDEHVLNVMYRILSLLRSRIKYDFSNYRKQMLFRRIQRRMCVCQTETIQQYYQFIKDNPEETTALKNDLLIGVTAFFRDEKAFTVLESLVVSELITRCSEENPIRIWIPACATGEEVYTITMLMFEAFEKANKQVNLQVFASDIDEQSINVARHGIYPKSTVGILSEKRLQRFFDITTKGEYQIKKVIRESIVFAKQNLISDAPFSRLDLISCRNLFIYFQPELQANVLRLFHFALKPDSYLMLGPSESLGKMKHQFETLSKKWRVFKTINLSIKNSMSIPMNRTPTPHFSIERSSKTSNFNIDASSYTELVNRDLLKAYAPATVLINRSYEILHYQGTTVNFLEFPKGSPSNDLLVLLREGLRARIRSAIHYVQKENKAIKDVDARVKRNGHYVPCTLTVRPVYEQNLNSDLLLISFEEKQSEQKADVPQLLGDIDATAESSIVTQLEYELNATREDLHSTVEELESSNEELKVTNEELMSMNEELQSANEELETSKEELQSMNEEINTVNTELQCKVEELEHSYNDTNNLLTSTDIATIFLNRNMQVMLFNPPIAELLNIRISDIGRSISDFSANVSNEGLLTDAKLVLEKLTPRETDVWTNQHGSQRRCYLRRIVPYRTTDDHINGVVITFIDITEQHKKKEILKQCVQERTQSLHEREARLNAIMLYSFEAIIISDLSGTITDFNNSAQTMFGYDREEVLGSNLQLLIPSINIKELNKKTPPDREFDSSTLLLEQKELQGSKKNNTIFPISISLTKVHSRALTIGIISDLSEAKELKKAIVNISTLEQEKIGHEIHDSLGQRLTGISLLASNLKRSLQNNDDKQTQVINNIIEQLSQAIGETRNFSHILAPVLSPPYGLTDALTSLMKSVDSTEIKKEIVCDSNIKIEDYIVATQVYRIAQEAIHNILKHAQAHNLTLQLQAQKTNTTLVITDDGIGFDINAPKIDNGIGLQVMKYRASSINATLDIISSPGKGTTLRCVF